MSKKLIQTKDKFLNLCALLDTYIYAMGNKIL